MRIGVITFSQSKENYGQLLQCYAMQRYLQSLGHSPFLIQYDFIIKRSNAKFRISSLFKYICNLPMYVSYVISLKRQEKEDKKYVRKNQSIDRHFSDFLHENFDLSQLYTAESIVSNPPIADAYVCGSDQIWGSDDAFFLNFAPDDAIKIAYAPSFGGVTFFSPEKEEVIKKYLSRFNFIGVREQTGVETCQRLGFKDAVRVVDPTLLLNSNDYDAIRANIPNKRPYIFLYLLGNPMDCSVDEIMEFAKTEGKEVIYVASQGRDDRYPKTYATIGEWLGYLANADMVITNSFHCVVFAMKYKKQFVSIPLSGAYERMNCRIEELLDAANLRDRIWNHNFSEMMRHNIDFSSFESYVCIEKKKADSYMNNVLAK